MHKKSITLLLAVALGFYSCKKETFTIQGQVKTYDIFLPVNMLEPVEGLPVSIYFCSNPYIDNSLSQQKFRFNSLTDENGYYHFTIEEPENNSLANFNAYLVKSTAFDSTKVEWQYLSDSTFYNVIDWSGEILFSQAIGHSFNPGHGFKVVPAGWVVLKIENPTCSKITVGSGNHFALLNNSSNGSNLSASFWLKPSRIHRFIVSNSEGDNPIELGEIEVYIRNSFVRSSKPWSENLMPDTVVVDMSTWAVRVIKANLD